MKHEHDPVRDREHAPDTAAGPSTGDGDRLLETLLDTARELPREVPPRRDLWPELRHRLEDEARGEPARRSTVVPLRRPRRRVPASRPWRRWGALAATLVLALTALLLAGRGGDAEAPGDGGLETARAEYLAQRAPIRAELERSSRRWGPEVAAAMRADVAVVEGAVAEVEQAIERRPGDPHLRLLLADRYRRQADLLRRLRLRTAEL